MAGLWADFALAWMLLTRVALPRRLLPKSLPPLARTVWCFPLVGALSGAGAGAVFAFARALGLPAGMAALWALAGSLLVTGALHEDGLADVADGFGGGHDRAQKLAIMRDSRIGSYGVLALLFSLAIRATALGSLRDAPAAMAALTAAGALGRTAILIVLARIPPARVDGMAAPLRNVRASAIACGIALAGLVVFVALPSRAAFAASIVSVLSGLGAARIARRQIGGHTGDVLGATEQAAECAVLTVASAFFG